MYVTVMCRQRSRVCFSVAIWVKVVPCPFSPPTHACEAWWREWLLATSSAQVHRRARAPRGTGRWCRGGSPAPCDGVLPRALVPFRTPVARTSRHSWGSGAFQPTSGRRLMLCVRAAGRGAGSRVDVARWRQLPAGRTSRHALAFVVSSDWARAAVAASQCVPRAAVVRTGRVRTPHRLLDRPRPGPPCTGGVRTGFGFTSGLCDPAPAWRPPKRGDCGVQTCTLPLCSRGSL